MENGSGMQKSQNENMVQDQPDTPSTYRKERNATPPKLAVRPNENNKSKIHGKDRNGCIECNGVSGPPSGASSPSRPNSRSRAPGARKNRSKQQIASENQQLAGGRDQLESDLEEQQLLDAENELYGHEDLSNQTHGELSGEYDLSDGSGGEEEDEGHHGQGREVRDQVLQERRQRKPQRQRPHDESETGVRAFNVRRADPERRPMGMKLKRKDHSSAPNRPPEAASSQPPSREQDAQQSRPQIPRIPGLSLAEGGAEQSQNQERAQRTEPEESSSNDGKDVSIKFDLNLELEILVKAKIKGEVMVTFM